MAFVLASAYPTHSLAPRALALLSASHSRASISPAFVLGVLFALVGAALRLSAYRALGHHFTFVLTIRADHRLITTGPYARMRHPGYTGLVLLHAGLTLCGAARGGWWAEAGRHTTAGRALASLWAFVLCGIAMVVGRAPSEDAMLRKEFGREWEVYARRVPWLFVPYVL
jgi:protein-S-isoprenylcysteine O-methyltransferase Ste14